MPKSKLIEILTILDTKEWTKLHDYVNSPYFNKRQEVSQLFQFFFENKDQLLEKEINKKKLAKYFPPNTRFSEKSLAYLSNYLLKLTEDFLVFEKIKQDEIILNHTKLKLFIKKGLEKHFKFEYSKINKLNQKEKIREEHYWRNQFYISEVEAEAFIGKRQRRFDVSFQKLSDSLDHYFFYEKLRYSCAMVNLEGIASSKYDIKFIEQIIDHLQKDEEIDFQLKIYINIYQCLIQPEYDDQLFLSLRELIEENQYRFSKQEFRNILLFTINLCARKTRLGFEEYYAHALELYIMGIENKSLFEGKNLTHWTFNNVVKVALRLQRYEWLESFIKDYSVFLSPRVREESMNFSLAELAFSKKDYGAVLSHIHQIKFTDPQYYLGSRIMLLKSFYALKEFDSMSSQLASFIMFLRRNKKISTDYKKTMLNFCSLLHLVLRSRPDKKEKVIQRIKETQQKVEGPWLLEVADNMMRY